MLYQLTETVIPVKIYNPYVESISEIKYKIHSRVLNLNGINLSKLNLSEAHLTGANLSGANLNGANLNGADLTRTDLTNAVLNRAHLNGANLSGADLNRAHFNGAHLNGAHLIHIHLNEANLSAIPVNEILKLRQTLTKKGLQAFCGMLGSKYYPTSQQFLFFNKRFGFVFSV